MNNNHGRAGSISAMAAASSSERPKKLQRLNDLGRSCPYVSKSALESILADCKESGIPDLSNSKCMTEATRLHLGSHNHYGPMLVEKSAITLEDKTLPILLANGLTLLAQAFYQGGAWSSMLESTHALHPSSFSRPWSLTIYTDEVTPGNVLAHRQEPYPDFTCLVFSSCG